VILPHETFEYLSSRWNPDDPVEQPRGCELRQTDDRAAVDAGSVNTLRLSERRQLRFLPRDGMLVRHMAWLCPSVNQVCPSQAGVLSKRLNTLPNNNAAR